MTERTEALAQALAQADASARLQAALAAGIQPEPYMLDPLIARCAIEPDFQVREMLTWALIRLPAAAVVPRLVAELGRPEVQARSQALHTLSKLGDPSAWPAVRACLDDTEQAVYRTAWYAAVAVVSPAERNWLAEKLATRLGEGKEELRGGLSRALIALGSETIEPVLAAAEAGGSAGVREHVALTRRLLDDPGLASAVALAIARREVALGRTRSAKG